MSWAVKVHAILIPRQLRSVRQGTWATPPAWDVRVDVECLLHVEVLCDAGGEGKRRISLAL